MVIFLRKEKNKVAMDYKGRIFSSISEMCRHHKVTNQTYFSRLKRGIRGKDLFKEGRIRDGSIGQPK